MSYNLFLDDDRTPEVVANFVSPVEIRKYYRLEQWVIVKNYPEFVDYISKSGMPAMISFDHDLTEGMYIKHLVDDKLNYRAKDFEIPENRTGWHCAEWILFHSVFTKQALPLCFVHSLNPVGKENILKLLGSNGCKLPGYSQ